MNTPLPLPGAPLEHYVSTAPFDPQSVEVMTEEQSRVYQASQLRLMWWKFKRHRLAYASGIFLALCYCSILISEFLAPYNLHTRNMDFIFSPPQRVRLFHEGQFVGPFQAWTAHRCLAENQNLVFHERTVRTAIRSVLRVKSM